ncbi:hypothetical protein Sm713_34380 [Streptomyces sp. TS71-3]|nr:hypothetical protein Sm713_34380 [Streptomyces sp. TS71-3]
MVGDALVHNARATTAPAVQKLARVPKRDAGGAAGAEGAGGAGGTEGTEGSRKWHGGAVIG